MIENLKIGLLYDQTDSIVRGSDYCGGNNYCD